MTELLADKESAGARRSRTSGSRRGVSIGTGAAAALNPRLRPRQNAAGSKTWRPLQRWASSEMQPTATAVGASARPGAAAVQGSQAGRAAPAGVGLGEVELEEGGSPPAAAEPAAAGLDSKVSQALSAMTT